MLGKGEWPSNLEIYKLGSPGYTSYHDSAAAGWAVSHILSPRLDGPLARETVGPLHFLTHQPRSFRKSLPTMKLQRREMAPVSAAWLPPTGESREGGASKAPSAKGRMVSARGDTGSNIFQEAGLT